MSEEPQQDTKSMCPHPEAVGTRWSDPISEVRQAELKTLADKQREWVAAPEAERGDSYFQDVMLSGADAFWLAAYALAGPEGDLVAARKRLHAAQANLPAAQADLRELIAQFGGTRPDLSAAYANLLDDRTAFGTALSLHLSTFHIEAASLLRAHMEGAYLAMANLEKVGLREAHLEGAFLSIAHLEGATLRDAHLERASLDSAHLEGSVLLGAHLEEADLLGAHLERADLRAAVLDPSTDLRYATFATSEQGAALVADVRWGDVNLAVVADWSAFTKQGMALGDEQAAWIWKPEPFTETTEQHQQPRRKRAQARATYVQQQAREHLAWFQAAVRANRQLATALRDQGMNEEAAYFAYRAQLCYRQVLRRQGRLLSALGSWFLDLVAGYGYRPIRSFLTYLLVVLGFAAAYFALGGANGKTLSWNEAIVVSMTAFHGRGFFAAVFQPGDLQAAVAAVEAFFGLLIEITFITTFTQRFFAR